LVVAAACDATAIDDPNARCGPAQAVVERVVDGDTVELDTGERVRYLLVDSPELGDCFGAEAAEHNRRLVEGETVTLDYDVQCRDDYDRLLAHVAVGGREIDLLLVERGLACTLVVPPNGSDRAPEVEAAEARARREGVGLWGACEDPSCD
jgi:micrococcal nuclease